MKSSIPIVFLALVCVGNSDYGYGPPVRTEYGAPAAGSGSGWGKAVEWEEFPTSVFQKLLKIEKAQLISRPMVAIGSVIVSMGARLLAPPKAVHVPHRHHHVPRVPSVAYGVHQASSTVNAYVPRDTQHQQQFQPPATAQFGGHNRYKRSGVNPAAGLRRSRARLLQDAKESEEFLERAMSQIVTDNPTEAGQLFKSLRRAYNKILGKSESLAEIAAELQEAKNAANSNEENRGWGKPDPVSREIKQFFALISGFDERSCMEKLFCDIHSTEVSEDDEIDQDENFKVYEENVVSIFKTLWENQVSSFPTILNYVKAARAGQRPLANCRQTYNNCPYTSKEIMQLGYGLEQSARD